jgi:hypothetical protein
VNLFWSSNSGQQRIYLNDRDSVPVSLTITTTEIASDCSESLLFDQESEFEDEGPALVLYGKTTLNRSINNIRPHTDVMDGLKRARSIKAEVSNNISVLKPQDQKTSTRRNPEEDPENIIIKTLRQEQKLPWSEIANYLNQERRNKGEVADFTDAAVYSRFVRNAPRIATPVGEIGFDPRDYMHLRHPNQYTQAEGTGTISKAGKKRVKNYDNATELRANVRQASEDNDDLQTAEKTDQLMEAVAKVERNFWKIVADEMERATTKLYKPDELSRRYHSI